MVLDIYEMFNRNIKRVENMKLEINIKKRHFFAILGAILLLGILGVVYAFGTSNPSSFGHSVGEIDWSQEIQSSVRVRDDIFATNLYASDPSDGIGIQTNGVSTNNIVLGGKTITQWDQIGVSSVFYYLGVYWNAGTATCWFMDRAGAGTQWTLSVASSGNAAQSCAQDSVSRFGSVFGVNLPQNMRMGTFYNTGASGNNANHPAPSPSSQIYVEIEYSALPLRLT